MAVLGSEEAVGAALRDEAVNRGSAEHTRQAVLYSLRPAGTCSWAVAPFFLLSSISAPFPPSRGSNVLVRLSW